ncbi:MAG: hypothetical protein H6831_16590 [Planctomycetes bacterium]|nr:hypothetical protein [Planctomycetota bacterium]MCB9906020.1 hypothetical protein [Planctomycetota bacterium]
MSHALFIVLVPFGLSGCALHALFTAEAVSRPEAGELRSEVHGVVVHVERGAGSTLVLDDLQTGEHREVELAAECRTTSGIREGGDLLYEVGPRVYSHSLVSGDTHLVPLERFGKGSVHGGAAWIKTPPTGRAFALRIDDLPGAQPAWSSIIVANGDQRVLFENTGRFAWSADGERFLIESMRRLWLVEAGDMDRRSDLGPLPGDSFAIGFSNAEPCVARLATATLECALPSELDNHVKLIELPGLLGETFVETAGGGVLYVGLPTAGNVRVRLWVSFAGGYLFQNVKYAVPSRGFVTVHSEWPVPGLRFAAYSLAELDELRHASGNAAD